MKAARRGSGRQRAAIVVFAAVGLVLAALVASEGAMDPAGADRRALSLAYAGVAVVATVLALLGPRLAARSTSLRRTVLVASVVAVALAAAAVLAAGATMFLSPDDLRLVLVALGLGAGLGVLLAVAVARPLEDDLARLRVTAQAVADGRLDVTTQVARPDEVGEVADVLDAMIVRLAASDAEQQRMEGARRDFFAAIGHDLRTPLTSLRSAVEALQDGMADDPDRFLRAMHADVDLLSGLVDDLFLLARIESGGLDLRTERLDLREVADEVVEVLRHTAAAGDRRLVLRTDGPAWVAGGQRELVRVLRNLVGNALRHGPPGSTVTVAVTRGAEDVQVRVCDEGDGFAPDFVDRAFASFVRADDARRRDTGGAGLGLAIARGLVRAHGGDVTARAGPGGEVTVRLPAA